MKHGHAAQKFTRQQPGIFFNGQFVLRLSYKRLSEQQIFAGRASTLSYHYRLVTTAQDGVETMKIVRVRHVALAVGLALSVATGARATDYTWNTESADSSPRPVPIGNVLSFTSTAGGQVIDVAGWSSQNGGNFGMASLNEYSGYGLGVCNSNEFAGSCPQPQHTIDNNTGGYDDFVLITFSSNVTVDSISLKAFGGTDATYFVGTMPLTGGTFSLAALNPLSAGLGTAFQSSGGSSDRAISPIGLTGNFILIGASDLPLSGADDFFKITALTASAPVPVPEPATWSLMIAGFGAMGWFCRRRRVSC